jgi:hypothetical protein
MVNVSKILVSYLWQMSYFIKFNSVFYWSFLNDDLYEHLTILYHKFGIKQLILDQYF